MISTTHIQAQTFGILNYSVLFIYLAAMFLVGLYFAGKQKTTEDYFLAGRKMPWLVVGMSMFASLTSASTYLGVPALAYSKNIAVLFGVLLSPVIAPVIIYTFYPFYQKLKVTTSYEYIHIRFGFNARLTVSALFILGRIAWLGVVIYGPALALSIASGLDLKLSILLMGILATVYTAMGGLSAVLWTDAIQFIILTFGAVWLCVSLMTNIDGGLSEVIHVSLKEGKTDIFNFNVLDWPQFFYQMTAAGAAFSWFFVFMHDYGTDQVTVQRLISTGSVKSTAKAVFFNAISDVVINSLLILIGLGMFTYYLQNNISESLAADQVMPRYIVNNLPAGISGLLLTAVFAAAMSSMDSGINSISAVIVNDYILTFSKHNLSDRSSVAIARILTVLLGFFATAAAFYASKIGSIVEAWGTFMSLFSGPILAIFILGIFFRKANFKTWIISCMPAIYLTYLVQNRTKVCWFYYLPISFGISFLCSFILSLIIPGPEAPAGTTIQNRN